MKTNDTKIIELQKIVQNKKDTLKEYKKSWMLTNGIFNIEIPFSDKVWMKNLNTLTQWELSNTFVSLCLLQEKSKELGVTINSWSYKLEEIISDVENKLKEFEYKTKKQELDLLQSKLDTMLSQDKKYELELDNISSLLKDL
jgi:transcriptional regulator with XRE-family HTH domain